MWRKIADYILRHRMLNFVLIAIALVFSLLEATKVKMSYEIARSLPESDSTMIEYQNFMNQYGRDGSVIFVCIQDKDLYTLSHFNAWYDLNQEIGKIDGIEGCLSITNVIDLKKNDSIKKFDLVKVVPERPSRQSQVDSIKKRIDQLAIYDGLLFNADTDVTLMMITVEKELLDSKERTVVVYKMKEIVDKFSEDNGVKTCISGLPYIRTITTKKMETEVILFIILSIIVAATALYLMFKSFKTLMNIMIIVVVSVGFLFGTIGLFGFKITAVSSVLPPLLIIICVENSIFLLNKYMREYKACGDKMQALSTVIQRIGSANFLTNATTAASFASFIITGNQMLVEFGIVASINIFLSYLLTLILIPTLFSYQQPPVEKEKADTFDKVISSITQKAVAVVSRYRTIAYCILCALVAVAVFGVLKVKTTGCVVDDISKKDRLYKDLMFFEKNFNGVMPYEITIDTRKPKGILKASFINKIQQLQDTLALYPEFSDPLSIAEVVKFAKEGFYNGDKKFYSIPNSQEFNFIMPYISNMKGDGMPPLVKSFIDEDMQKTRVSVQMANVTTPKIDSINESLKPKIAEIFPPEKYDVCITGNSVVFLKGTNYLIQNLMYSLFLAFVVIAILVAFTSTSLKLVVISMVPNLVPLLFTAGLMGYTGISLKTSSIIVFSIALGISVDNTIHYLSRYRQQRRLHNDDIKKSVVEAILETVPSMLSSAAVLICGFLIFAFSSFGGIEIVGYLVPFTLLVALTTNMFILPSLILTFHKKKIS